MSAALNGDGGIGGLIPHGPREQFRLTGRALCDEANDRILAALTDEDRELAFISSLTAGLRRCDRTCMNLYAEMRGLVGSKLDLAAAVMAAVGAGAVLARSAVETVNRASLMSEPAVCREMIQHLREYAAKVGCEWTELEAKLSSAEVEP